MKSIKDLKRLHKLMAKEEKKSYSSNWPSYSITLAERQSLYDKEYHELMDQPKEELVKMIIGERPVS